MGDDTPSKEETNELLRRIKRGKNKGEQALERGRVTREQKNRKRRSR